MGTMSDYLAGLAPGQREALQRVVDVATRVAPDAEEGTKGRHAGPARRRTPAHRVRPRPSTCRSSRSARPSEAVAADLEGFSLSKGTIRFTVDRPIPDDVLERVVRLRRAELGS